MSDIPKRKGYRWALYLAAVVFTAAAVVIGYNPELVYPDGSGKRAVEEPGPSPTSSPQVPDPSGPAPVYIQYTPGLDGPEGLMRVADTVPAESSDAEPAAKNDNAETQVAEEVRPAKDDDDSWLAEVSQRTVDGALIVWDAIAQLWR